MKLVLRNRYLSGPRYNRYLIATGNNRDRARKLYKANIRLAQSFHPLLSQFEVILRNSLNMILSSYFTDADWIIHQKNGFMRDLTLGPQFYLRNAVQKTEGKLRRRSIPATSSKIIADQTLGFWTSFFLPHHYSLVAGQPIHVFPYKPATENRASILAKLDDIQRFRNRVNHCEPLCFNGHHINCSEALRVRTRIYDLVSWINPELVSFLEEIDNIVIKTNYIMTI